MQEFAANYLTNGRKIGGAIGKKRNPPSPRFLGAVGEKENGRGAEKK